MPIAIPSQTILDSNGGFQNPEGPKTGKFTIPLRKSCPPKSVRAHTKGVRRVLRSENSRRLWLFLGSARGFPREISGKSRENCWKFFPNREMLQIIGFWAPGKTNLPGTFGRHCLDLVPTFRAGCFLKSTVPAFSSFSD